MSSLPTTAQNTPFFVIGSPRSGTTMLRLMLNRHSRLRVPKESWFLIPLLLHLPLQGPLIDSQLKAIFRRITSEPRWQDWNSSEAALREAVFGEPGVDLAGVIDRVFRLTSGMEEGMRWGDKTPIHSLYVAELATIYPQAKFLHIIRDGRDVLHSMKRLKWYGRSVRRIARCWRSMIFGAIKGRALGPDRYMELHYEDLVKDLRGSLERICDFLGEPFEPAMLGFYQTAAKENPAWEGNHEKTSRAPSPTDLQLWRSECSIRDILSFEAMAGDAMDAVGQQRRFRGSQRLFLMPWQIRHRFADFYLELKGKILPPPAGEKIHTGPLICEDE